MRSLILASVFLLAAPAQANNLIINGGFEEPRVTDGPYVHLNGTELPGWNSFSNYRGTVLFSSGLYDPVAEGSQAVQIEVPGDWITQSFATVIGQSYELSFDLSAVTHYGGPGLGRHPCPCISILDVFVGPISETFTGSSAGYANHTVDFTADSPVTTLKFQNPTIPAGWGNYPQVDNVSIIAVPEPNAGYLLLSGLAALGLCLRRRYQVDFHL